MRVLFVEETRRCVGDEPEARRKPVLISARRPLSAVLLELAHDVSRERISIRDLFEAMADRALAALIFVFAVPSIFPVPPGVSGVLGVPLVFLAAQLALGRAPWLPAFLTSRSMARSDFQSLMRRVLPWLGRAERLLRPRLQFLASGWMEQLVGCVCILLAIVLALPIPLGNTPPAIAISVLALGILEKDGYWVLSGLVLSALAFFIVSGVLLAMIKMVAYLMVGLV